VIVLKKRKKKKKKKVIVDDPVPEKPAPRYKKFWGSCRAPVAVSSMPSSSPSIPAPMPPPLPPRPEPRPQGKLPSPLYPIVPPLSPRKSKKPKPKKPKPEEPKESPPDGENKEAGEKLEREELPQNEDFDVEFGEKTMKNPDVTIHVTVWFIIIMVLMGAVLLCSMVQYQYVSPVKPLMFCRGGWCKIALRNNATYWEKLSYRWNGTTICCGNYTVNGTVTDSVCDVNLYKARGALALLLLPALGFFLYWAYQDAHREVRIFHLYHFEPDSHEVIKTKKDLRLLACRSVRRAKVELKIYEGTRTLRSRKYYFCKKQEAVLEKAHLCPALTNELVTTYGDADRIAKDGYKHLTRVANMNVPADKAFELYNRSVEHSIAIARREDDVKKSVVKVIPGFFGKPEELN
jgi:hypothetical protein